MLAYLLLIEVAGESILATTKTDGKTKMVVSTEENKYLLYELGNRLIEDGTITGYQLLKTASPVIREV